MVSLDPDMEIAGRGELFCLLIIPLIVTLVWQVALLLAFPLLFFLPIIVLVGLNFLFLYQQCKSGFSTGAIYFRLIINCIGIVCDLLFVTVLYGVGYTVPQSSASPTMIPYTYAGVMLVTCIIRTITMLVLLLLRSSGYNV